MLEACVISEDSIIERLLKWASTRVITALVTRTTVHVWPFSVVPPDGSREDV